MMTPATGFQRLRFHAENGREFPEWKSLPFGSVIEEYAEKTKTENEDTLISCAIDGMYLNSELFGHQRGASNIGYRKIYKDTLILSAQNLHLGNANVNTRFEHGIISPAYKTYNIKKDICSPTYLSFWVKRDATRDFFYNATTVGASVCRRNVEWDSLYAQNLQLPSLPEQQKIAAFLSAYDKKISLQRERVETLKEQKKGLLQKMFPKKGETVPELRFPGFTGDWEQRKLSDVVNVYDGVHQTPEYKDEGVMFLSVENITTLKSKKYISEEAFERDYKVYPEKGDILMTRIGDIGTPNVVESSEKLAFYVSLALLKPHGIDSYYLKNAIQSKSFQKGLRERSLLTAIPMKINKDEIGKVDVFIPKDIEEQKKIGAAFKKLDHLITLHQRKLETMQEIKKGLLQQLFC